MIFFSLRSCGPWIVGHPTIFLLPQFSALVSSGRATIFLLPSMCDCVEGESLRAISFLDGGKWFAASAFSIVFLLMPADSFHVGVGPMAKTAPADLRRARRFDLALSQPSLERPPANPGLPCDFLG